MSTTVDQRVVEMKFDNRQFESGVRESMSTLDKLKQALNFNKTATGLENISKEVSKVDMSSLADSTQAVTNKFSALDVIAVTALVRITNAAMSAGTALVKSLTIDQVTSGWAKFEEKTTAVQTIMSATRTQFDNEAQQLAVINSKLQELNWFTDETSYNFTDMVSNIGKFTSAGVDLDTAAKSMQGIATWAAMSGANAVTASRAMYNLAQAIGVGYVKLIDWKTIENCNMATMEFKQTVLETAVELGTLRKEADGVYKTVAKGTKVTAETFSESLSEGWFSNSVLTKSLETYNKATEKLHEMAERYNKTATDILGAFDDYKSGASTIEEITKEFELSGEAAKEFAADLDILNSEEYELSISAFKAAQQAKTFTDVIDATKDAVSTGWMNTFEYIFGNYHEAVELFSDLCEVFYDLFAAGAEARNEILGIWKALGGREALLEGIYKAFENLGTIIDFVKEAWFNLFGKEYWQKAAGLLKVTDYISALFKWLAPTQRELENIAAIFNGLYSVLDLVGTVLKSILKSIFPMITPARGILDIVLELGGALGRLILEMTSYLKVVVESTPIFELIGRALRNFVLLLIYVIVNIGKFISKFDIFNKVSKVFTIAVNALAVVFKILGTAVIFAVNGIIAFVQLIKSVAESIVSSFKRITKWGVDGLKAAIIIAKEALLSFLNSLKNVPVLGKAIEKLSSIIVKLKEKISSLSADSGKVTSFFTKFGEVIASVTGVLGKFVTFLIEAIKNINPVRLMLSLFVASITLAIYRFSKAFKGVPALISSITSVFDALHSKIKPRLIKVSVLQIAAAIAILAGSLYLIANGVDPNRLWECIGAIGVLAGIIVLLTSAAAALTLVLDKVSRNDNTMLKVGSGVLALAASVLVLAAAMRVLNLVDLDGIWERLGVLASIAIGLATISIILSKMAPKMSKDSIMLLAFAISISSMVKSLKVLAELNKDPEELQRLVTSLIELMAGISMLAFASKSIGLFSAVGLIALVLTFKMVLPMLDEIANHDYSKIKDAIYDNTDVMVAMVALATLMIAVGALYGKNINKFGMALLAMAAAVVVLIKAMSLVEQLDPDKFYMGIIAVDSCLALFGLLAVLSKFTQKSQPVKFAASLVIMSIAVSLLVNISKKLTDVDRTGLMIGEAAVLAIMGMVAILEVLSKEAKNINGVAKVLIAISVIAIEMAIISLIPWQDILSSAVAMGIAMLAFGKAVQLATSKKWNAKGIMAIVAVAMSCAVLGAAMTVLAQNKWQSIAMAGAAMAAAISTFAWTLELISEKQGFNDTGRCLKKVGAALVIAGALSILGFAMSDLAKNDWGSIAVAGIAMLACMVVFAKTLNFLSGFKDKKLEGWKTILAMSAELIAIAGFLKIMSTFEWTNIKDCLLAMGVALGYYAISITELALLSKLSEKVDGSAFKNILAVSLLLLAIGGLIKVLSSVPWKEFPKEAAIAIGAIGVVALVMSVVAKFANGATKTMKKVAKKVNPATYKDMLGTAAILASMCALVASMAISFKIVSDTVKDANPLDVISSFAIITGFVVALGVAMYAINKSKALYKPKSFEMIFAMAAAMLAMAGSMKLLSNISWGNIAPGLAAILIVLYVFGDILKAISTIHNATITTGNSNDTMLTIILFCGLLLTFGYVTEQLNQIGWDNVGKSLIAITLVLIQLNMLILELYLVDKFIKKVESFYSILAASALLVAIGVSLSLLSNCDWDGIWVSVKAMAVVLVELFLVICQMALIENNIKGPMAFKGILAMCALLLSVGLSLMMLAEIPYDEMGWALLKFTAVILELTLVVTLLTYLLKGLHGPDIVKLGLGLTVSLIGMAISLAILAAIPDDNVLTGIGRLAAVCLVLVAVTAILAKIGPIASVSFPTMAVAMLALCAGFAVVQFMDWDAITYGFTRMMLMAGVMVVVGGLLAGFAAIAEPAAVAITVAILCIAAIAAVFGVVALIFSAAANNFANATMIMAAACQALVMVNWDYLASSIPKALLALTSLGIVMAMFTLASVGALALLGIADALNTLSHIAYNDLSTLLSTATIGLIHLYTAVDLYSTSKVKLLVLIVSSLQSLSTLNLNGFGTNLTKIAMGLFMISNALNSFSSSGVGINDVISDLMLAKNNITSLGLAFEIAAKKIETSNSKILSSTSLLGKFFNTGIGKGLASTAQPLFNLMSSITTGLIDTFATTAEIKSPSRAMARMGSFLMQGVSVGAIEESPNVYKTMGLISTNTVRAADITSKGMYTVGQNSIKSQSKGMADAAKNGTIKTATEINKKTLQVSGKLLTTGEYANGLYAEEAKAKGMLQAAPSTGKAIIRSDKALVKAEEGVYDEGYGIVGEVGGAAAAEGVATGTTNNADIFMSAGGTAAGGWWSGFKNTLKAADNAWQEGWREFNKDTQVGATSVIGGVLSFAGAVSESIGDAVSGTNNFFDAYKEHYASNQQTIAGAVKTAEEFWTTNEDGASKTSGIVDTISEALNLPNLNDFMDTDFLKDYQAEMDKILHDQQYANVLWGQTKEWQDEYKAAMDAGDTERMQQLAREAGTMVEISKYSEDYYRITGEGNSIMYDSEAITRELEESLANLGNTTSLSGQQVDEFTENFKNLQSTIEGQIDVWNEFDRTVDITSEDILRNLQSQISGVNEWSNKILVLAQRGISKGILEELANMGPQGYKYVEAFIQMTGEELATINDLWVEKGTLSTSSTLAIQAAYALAGDQASMAYVTGLGMNLDQVQKAAQQLSDSLTFEVSPEALKAIDAYKEQFNSLYDSIESSINIFEAFNMETETTSDEMLENMRSQIEGVTKWSENLRILGERGISDGLLKELSALGPDGYDKVNAFVEMTQSQLQEANDLYAQSLELPASATANVLSGYAQAGDDSAKAFIEALGASVSNVSQIGTYILEGLQAGLFDSEATASLTTTAYGVGDSIITQLMKSTDSHSPSERARAVGIWVDRGLELGLNEASVLPAQACVQMAEFMMQGLVNGISSGSARVVDAMVNVCMEAKAAAERALKIESPSKVFAQIGKYTVMGFSEGIDQNAQMVANSTEEMGNASINTLKDALVHARDLINGDIDNTITLTPVLDLSNVRAGVQQINGMMNSASVSANATVNGSEESGTNQNGGMTFIQNNYSPKALNRIDIYRQTKNQFAAMKGLVSGT